MLDTNSTTYLINGRSREVRNRFKAESQAETVVISAITQAEICFGLENKPSATRLRSAVEEFFEAIEVVAWDSAVARIYGQLRARLARAGTTISALDLLIAAHALATEAVLVTHDQALLKTSAFLNVVDWATDLQ